MGSNLGSNPGSNLFWGFLGSKIAMLRLPPALSSLHFLNLEAAWDGNERGRRRRRNVDKGAYAKITKMEHFWAVPSSKCGLCFLLKIAFWEFKFKKIPLRGPKAGGSAPLHPPIRDPFPNVPPRRPGGPVAYRW